MGSCLIPETLIMGRGLLLKEVNLQFHTLLQNFTKMAQYNGYFSKIITARWKWLLRCFAQNCTKYNYFGRLLKVHYLQNCTFEVIRKISVRNDLKMARKEENYNQIFLVCESLYPRNLMFPPAKVSTRESFSTNKVVICRGNRIELNLAL